MRKKIIIFRIIGFFVAYIFIAGLFQVLSAWLTGMSLTAPGAMSDWQLFATVVGSFLGTLLVLYIFTKWVDKIPFTAIGLSLHNFKKDFALGVLLGLLPIVLGFIMLYALGLIQHITIDFRFDKLLLSILIFLLVAFNEEAFLRGYVLRNLMLAFNKYTALITSALLFALMHIFNDHLDIVGFINIFLAGILLGMSYIFTKNLWFPIGLHFAWNLAQSLLGFNVSGNNTYSVLHYDLSDKLTWISGGAFGFEASVVSLIFELLLIFIVYRLFKDKEWYQ